MHKKLKEIIAKTKEDIKERKKQVPPSVMLNSFQHLKSKQRRFRNEFGMTLRKRDGKLAIIAEVKFASPSEVVLGSQKDFLKRIKEYEKAGVDCLSIVTEKHFFKGDMTFVSKAKKITKLPVLQKDFVVDPYQIYEAKKKGADAILLIARIVTKNELVAFVDTTYHLGVEPVVEIHNGEDLEKALATKARIIAVNARDLDTFKVDVDRACQLLKKVPSQCVKLGFSGIKSKQEVEQYKDAGADGVLIGTSLMRAKNIQEFLEGLR